MHALLVSAPLARLALLSALIAFPAFVSAQTSHSPIRRALYVALGGDPATNTSTASVPLAATVGVEQSRVGSRWAFRLGADYRRVTESQYSTSRWEDFGLGLTARYGRSSGAIRPYLLGGVGVAQQRTRIRNARYYFDPEGLLFPPTSLDRVGWNGLATTGLGTDVTFRGVNLFTEARFNLFPGQLSSLPYQSSRLTKALYFGVKF